MKEIRRNDPCHCGSGKKYKKCCLIKDAAAEKEQAAQEFLKPLSDDSILENEDFDEGLEKVLDGDIIEYLDEEFDEDEFIDDGDENFPRDPRQYKQISDKDDPEISDEDKKRVDEWWDKYLTLKDPLDERLHLDKFIEAHPDLVIHLGLHHEVLFELGASYLKLGKIDDHIQFLLKIREEFPDSYLKSFGYYDSDIIAWLISKNRADEVSGYLENYILYPVDFVDKLFELINLLQATDMVSDLLHLIKNVYEPICCSGEVINGYEILTPLVNEIYAKYLKPDFSDDDFGDLVANLKEITIELNDDVYTQAYWRVIFEKIFRPYVVWKPSQPVTNRKVRDLHSDMATNFMRFLKEKTGISWVSANYYSMLVSEYLHTWHKDTKKRNHALFDFSKKIMDKLIAGLAGKMGIYLDVTKTMSLFNAIYYFAEYLAACGNIDQNQASTIQSDCTDFFNKIYSSMGKREIETLVFSRFPQWG